MSKTLVRRSHKDWTDKRARLLKQASASEEELRDRAARGEITAADADLLDRLDEIDYLLKG